MNKLAAIALKHKALKYGIPANQGWLTRQQAARQLGCPERNVHDLLRDAIEARDIETKKFSDWDAATMRPVQVTCYRIIEPTAPKPAKASATAAKSAPDELTAAIHRVIARHPDKPLHRIVAYLPPRIRSGVTSAQVAAILSR
jgi:hypothetical protein